MLASKFQRGMAGAQDSSRPLMCAEKQTHKELNCLGSNGVTIWKKRA